MLSLLSALFSIYWTSILSYFLYGSKISDTPKTPALATGNKQETIKKIGSPSNHLAFGANPKRPTLRPVAPDCACWDLPAVPRSYQTWPCPAREPHRRGPLFGGFWTFEKLEGRMFSQQHLVFGCFWYLKTKCFFWGGGWKPLFVLSVPLVGVYYGLFLLYRMLEEVFSVICCGLSLLVLLGKMVAWSRKELSMHPGS